jgi:hypothetical protein
VSGFQTHQNTLHELTGQLIVRIIQQTLAALEGVPLQDETAVHAALDTIKQELGVGVRDVMNTLRHALTGSKVGLTTVIWV